MKTRWAFFGLACIILSACAAYQMQPLSITHPANAQAVAAPAPPRSKTLTYSRGDMPTVSAAATPKGEHDTKSNGEKNVVGEGKVIATVPSANQLVIEHGEIKDFMEAMTMGYRVEPSSLLEGLNSGDRVRFTIDVPNKMITKIEKIK